MPRPNYVNQDNGKSFENLLSRAKAGEEEALCELFEACQKYLLLIANQDISPAIMQKFAASDAVQQTLLIANRQLPEFRGGTKGEFLSWMKQILANQCRQHSRRYAGTAKRAVSREQSVVTSSGSKEYVVDLKDPHLTPGTTASSEEQAALIKRALDELDSLDRAVIEMRNWQELSFADIGQEIGKSDEATRKIWSRAILKLEKRLRDLGVV
jgi:RNA polymerase sigma-70 factor (ECF subfamily)